MTKQELAKMLADRAGLDSAAQGGKVIDIVLESIKEELAAGGTVPLRGSERFRPRIEKPAPAAIPGPGKPYRSRLAGWPSLPRVAN